MDKQKALAKYIRDEGLNDLVSMVLSGINQAGIPITKDELEKLDTMSQKEKLDFAHKQYIDFFAKNKYLEICECNGKGCDLCNNRGLLVTEEGKEKISDLDRDLYQLSRWIT
ncbi:MAG: hypothetical protein ACOC2W_02070 [bacterium]